MRVYLQTKFDKIIDYKDKLKTKQNYDKKNLCFHSKVSYIFNFIYKVNCVFIIFLHLEIIKKIYFAVNFGWLEKLILFLFHFISQQLKV